MDSRKKEQPGEKRENACGCAPEDFQDMREMMKKCCPGWDALPDCAVMMAAMRDMCSGSNSSRSHKEGD